MSRGSARETSIADLVTGILGGTLPIGVRAYDGSRAGPQDAAATIVLRSPDALRRIVTAPGELGIGRAYVAGDIDVEGDIFAALELRHQLTSLQLSREQWLTAVRLLGTAGLRPLPPPPEAGLLRRRGQRTEVLEPDSASGVEEVGGAEPDAGHPIAELRIDGGMSRNTTFVQALADAAQKPVEVSPVKEATTLGAGFLAGLAVGTWPDLDAVGATWTPRTRHEPGEPLDRDRWARAVERARRWIPDLSTVDF